MPETTAEVILLSHTPDPLALVYAAFRQCYFAGSVAELWPQLLSGSLSRKRQAELVTRILESGHASPIEHVSFTFALSGVSRALTHQLVRHRIASYSQQSQRYVEASNFEYVVPPRIKANAVALERFTTCMDQIAKTYGELRQLLGADGSNANEDARFVLPQATASRIVVTMNCRSLLNFFQHRCCTRAQWEIRHVANTMLALCRDVLPEIFTLAGARCEQLGYCPEGAFGCGRYPTRDNA